MQTTEFDEGWMRDKTIQAAEEMIYALAVMDDIHPDVDPEKYPLRYMFQTTWRRFQEVRIFYYIDGSPCSKISLGITFGHREIPPQVCLVQQQTPGKVPCWD
jgi:hypothetical protein